MPKILSVIIIIILIILLVNMKTANSWSSLSKPSVYVPPKWAKFSNLPSHGERLTLANLPTPVYRLDNHHNHGARPILSRLQEEFGVSLYIKRDDMTGGVELGGNKVRKLEFLLADALRAGYDSVVTIGGEQSNHCRATAAAARMIGLEPHLILRTKRANSVHEGNNQDFGFVGNILIDRMIGSTIYTCTPGEYGRVGSETLVARVCAYLEKQGKKPYGIPVGGSNGLGSWGYINAVAELEDQWSQEDSDDGVATLDHVVFACGSGGTAAGIALGLKMCDRLSPKVHAVGVCDDPDYFYEYMAGIAEEMGLESSESALDFVRDSLIVHQGKGLGYASSTQEELDFVTQFAVETGVTLDPVYSGKALYHFVTHVLEDQPDEFRGKNVLFWHTGGALGMYDKGNDLSLEDVSVVKRLDVYGKNEEGMIDVSDGI